MENRDKITIEIGGKIENIPSEPVGEKKKFAI